MHFPKLNETDKTMYTMKINKIENQITIYKNMNHVTVNSRRTLAHSKT